MLIKLLNFRTALTLLLGLTLYYSTTFAQGYDRGNNRGYFKGERSYNRNDIRGHGRYFRNGMWFRHGWFGSEIGVPVFDGVIVSSLPQNCSVVMIQGLPYYFCNNMYYRQISGGGYIVGSVPPASY